MAEQVVLVQVIAIDLEHDDITQPYNTETEYLASTTGNITGIMI